MAVGLREVLATFGVQVEGIDKLNAAGGAIDGLVKKFAGAITAGAIGGFIKHMTNVGASIGDAAERTGVSADEFQRFSYAVGLAGGTAQDTEQALIMLQKNLKGGLGGKTATQAFEELATKIAATKDPAKQTQMAMEALGRSGAKMLPLLRQGADGVKGLASEYESLGLGLPDEFIENAKEADDNFFRLGLQARAMGADVANAVLPAISAFIKRIMALGAKVKHFIHEAGGFKKLALFAVFMKMASSILNVGSVVGRIVPIIRGLSSVFTMAKVGALGFYAAAALIFLAVDDFVGFLQGKDSLIGRWLTKAIGIEDTEALKKQLLDVWEQIKAAFLSAKPAIDELWKTFQQFMKDDGIPALIDLFVVLVKAVGAAAIALGSVGGAAVKLLNGDSAGAEALMKNAGDAVLGKTKTFVNKDGSVTTDNYGGLFGKKEPAIDKAGTPEEALLSRQNDLKRFVKEGKLSQVEADKIAQTNGREGAERGVKKGAPQIGTINSPSTTTINVTGTGDPIKTAEEVAKRQAEINKKNAEQAYSAATSYTPAATP